jgi:drug/metabolite transporter (DMT)-like permease
MEGPESPAPSLQGLTLTLLAGAIWGSSFVAIQVGLQATTPLLLVALRFGLAALLALGAATILRSARAILLLLRTRWVWGLGALNALGFGLSFLGQTGAGIADSTLLSNLFPALVPLFAAPLLNERVGSRQAGAVVLGLVGLVAVTAPGFASGGPALVGDGLLLGSAAVYALFIVLGKRSAANSPASSLALMVVMGVLTAPLIAASVLAHSGSALALPPRAWWAVLYLAFPCTIVALTLYLQGLRSISASLSSMLLLLEPITGLLLAALFYRASVTVPVILGAVLIVGALAIACWPAGRTHRPVASPSAL